jgi:hypothetical protein
VPQLDLHPRIAGAETAEQFGEHVEHRNGIREADADRAGLAARGTPHGLRRQIELADGAARVLQQQLAGLGERDGTPRP